MNSHMILFAQSLEIEILLITFVDWNLETQ